MFFLILAFKGRDYCIFSSPGRRILISWKRLWLLKYRSKECWPKFFSVLPDQKPRTRVDLEGQLAEAPGQEVPGEEKPQGRPRGAGLCAMRWDWLAEVLRRFSQGFRSFQTAAWKYRNKTSWWEERSLPLLIVLVVLAH